MVWGLGWFRVLDGLGFSVVFGLRFRVVLSGRSSEEYVP